MTDSTDYDPVRWYSENAAKYAAETESLDMSPQRKLFVDLLPFPAPGRARRVLDVGCGGGRDALAFRMEGLDVTALEPCPELAQIAATYAGVPVLQGRIEKFAGPHRFEGVWACASMVHLEEFDLHTAFTRVWDMLAVGGVFYTCFKRTASGATIATRQSANSERQFTDLSPAGLVKLFSYAALEMESVWCTRDARWEKDPARHGEVWVNGLARRTR